VCLLATPCSAAPSSLPSLISVYDRPGLYDGTTNVYKHILLGLSELFYGCYGIWQGYQIKQKIANSEGGKNGSGGGAQTRKIIKFLNGMCLCLCIVFTYRLTCLPRYGRLIWESPPCGPVGAMLNITPILMIIIIAIGLHLTKPIPRKPRRTMRTSTGVRTNSTQTGNVTTDSGQRKDYNRTGDTKTSNLNTADKIGRGKEDEWRPPENNSGLWPMFEDLCPIAAYTNPEVLGYLINGPGKGISYASYIFLFEALIHLANMDACGSVDNSYFDPVANLTVTAIDDFEASMFASTPCDHEPYECKEKIYGFRPASWIANIGTIGSLVTACFLPIAGAMIDFSASRKRIGFTAIMLVNVVGAIQIFIGQDNWLMMLLIQGFFGMFFYSVHQTAIFAYMPELTTDLKEELPMINATARAYEMGTNLIFILAIGFLPSISSLTVVDTARISLVVSTLFGSILCILSWRYLEARPAVQKLPDNRQPTCCNITIEGLKRIIRQSQNIAKDYPQCGKFLIAYTIFESSNNALFTLASPYLTQQLKFESTAYFVVIILSFTIVGTQLYKAVVSRVGMKIALLQSICYMTFLFIVFPCTIYAPEHKPWSFIYAVLIGLGLGWIYPAQRSMYVSLMPGGREGEFMGLFCFCGIILGWLPTVVFVIVYEAVGSMQLGFASIILGYILGGAVLTTVDMQKAKEDVLNTMDSRQGAFRWEDDKTGKMSRRSSKFGVPSEGNANGTSASVRTGSSARTSTGSAPRKSNVKVAPTGDKESEKTPD